MVTGFEVLEGVPGAEDLCRFADVVGAHGLEEGIEPKEAPADLADLLTRLPDAHGEGEAELVYPFARPSDFCCRERGEQPPLEVTARVLRA